MGGAGEPVEYLAQKLRDALAADARTGELGLDVIPVNGRLVVRGVVGSEQRHDAILEVAGEVIPEIEVVNETDVKQVDPPGDQESIR
ncbi:MAG: BON domain-containing protein [Actinomycetota bacterium]|nr:BON domain-containing protein [Actinomycetota bacterium]